MKFRVTMLLIVLIIMTVVLPMTIPGPDGKPVMTAEDWIPDVNGITNGVGEKIREMLYSASDAVESNTGVNVGMERPQMYKWQDENGNWHYSDRADMTAKNQTTEAMPKIKNSMGAPPDIDFGERGTARSGAGGGGSIPLPLSVRPDRIPELINNAKNVQKLADDRATKINQLR